MQSPKQLAKMNSHKNLSMNKIPENSKENKQHIQQVFFYLYKSFLKNIRIISQMKRTYI